MRVASLTPSNTEIVAFLGQTGSLVARDQFSDWPPAVLEVPSVGPDLQIDVDELAALEPDLVLCAESVPGMEHVNERVREASLDHRVLAPTSLADVLEDVRTIGQALDVPDRADRLAEAMDAEIDRVEGIVDGLDRPTVYWEWWPDPPITPGAGGWMEEVIARAGGDNAFSDRPDQSLEVDLDEIAERAPDVVALCWQGTLHEVQSEQRLRERDGGAWTRRAAVREGRVLERPEALYGRPGPRIVEGLRELAGLLHPDRAEQLEPAYGWVPDAMKERLPL